MVKNLMRSFIKIWRSNKQIKTSSSGHARTEFTKKKGEYDPDTHHGIHYKAIDFDIEVAKRVNACLARPGTHTEGLSDSDEQDLYNRYRKDVYNEWNRCSIDQLTRFEQGNTINDDPLEAPDLRTADGPHPFLESVHGMDRADYANLYLRISASIQELSDSKTTGTYAVIGSDQVRQNQPGQ